MMADVPEPGSEHRVTVRGYEVIVRTAPDGTLHVTCPELPQLDVRDETLTRALSSTEDAIDAIWAGKFERPKRSA
jgi:predicted RNase H-like HicB family nuclease